MKKNAGRKPVRAVRNSGKSAVAIIEQIRQIRRGIENKRARIRLNRQRAYAEREKRITLKYGKVPRQRLSSSQQREQLHEGCVFRGQLRTMQDHPLFTGWSRLSKTLGEISDALGLRIRYSVDPQLFKATPLPKRCIEMLDEYTAAYYAKGQTRYDAKMAKWREKYKKACYKLRDSEKKRKAVDCVRAWRNAIIWEKESGRTLADSERIALLAPLLNALPTPENPNRFDIEFLNDFAKAANFLDLRLYSTKDQTTGSGENVLDKWLLEYELRLPGGQATHTLRELNEQFVSKFRTITDPKLREKCHELDIPLKPDVRGAGAVRRKRSNGTPGRSKKY